MKPLIAILFACFLISVHSIAQRKFSEEPRKPDQFSMGVGFGQDFGGLGANIIVYPQKNIGLFVGGGYAIAGFGYNVGLKLRLTPPSSAVDPHFLAMYGYNAAIYVSGATNLNKIFYGPTFGIGIDLHKRSTSKGYWSFTLLVPVRSHDVQAYEDEIKTNYGVSMNDLLPITFSVGYKFTLAWFE